MKWCSCCWWPEVGIPENTDGACQTPSVLFMHILKSLPLHLLFLFVCQCFHIWPATKKKQHIQRSNDSKWQVNYDLSWVKSTNGTTLCPFSWHTVTIWQYCKLLAAMLIRIKLHLSRRPFRATLCKRNKVCVCSSFFSLNFYLYFLHLLRSVGVLILNLQSLIDEDCDNAKKVKISRFLAVFVADFL